MAVNYRCDGMSPRVGESVPATPTFMPPSGKTRLLKDCRNLRSRPGFRGTCCNSARRSIYRERRSSTNRCTIPLDCLARVFPVMPAWIYVWRGTLASGPKSAWWGKTSFDRGPWSMATPMPSSEPNRYEAFTARLHGGSDSATGPHMRTRLKLAIVPGAARITGLPGRINEYQVKAFFLYNFARYVEWPTLTPISSAVCRKQAVCPRVCPRHTVHRNQTGRICRYVKRDRPYRDLHALPPGGPPWVGPGLVSFHHPRRRGPGAGADRPEQAGRGRPDERQSDIGLQKGTEPCPDRGRSLCDQSRGHPPLRRHQHSRPAAHGSGRRCGAD